MKKNHAIFCTENVENHTICCVENVENHALFENIFYQELDTEDPGLVQFVYVFLQVKDCTNSRIVGGSSTDNAPKALF